MKLPVLLYHHVGRTRPGTYPSLTVSPAQFGRHLQWLALRGYVGVRPSQWVAWVREGLPLPDKPVLLTFDDAYADLADYALPVLTHCGFGAGVFVVTGYIGATNAWDEQAGSGTHLLMSAEQIRKWAVRGIEFGAHSRRHPALPTLVGTELDEEVAGSGRDLAAILQTPVVAFAYPGGQHDESVRRCVRSAFALAFTVEEGLNDTGTDLHLLRRTMVQPSDSLLDFACRVRLGWSPIERLRARVGLRTRLRRGARRFPWNSPSRDPEAVPQLLGTASDRC